MVGLRAQKRERTRRLLVESADRLFHERGYTATTMADIAAAAEVSTRTAFAYFPAKDELLFPDGEERIMAAVDALEHHQPDEDAVTALMRAMTKVGFAGADLLTERAGLRMSLMLTEPSVRGRALRLLADAQSAIGQALHRAYPDRYSPVQAAALVGSFIGAASGAVAAVLQTMPGADNDERRAALTAAVADSLTPWVEHDRSSTKT